MNCKCQIFWQKYAQMINLTYTVCFYVDGFSKVFSKNLMKSYVFLKRLMVPMGNFLEYITNWIDIKK